MFLDLTHVISQSSEKVGHFFQFAIMEKTSLSLLQKGNGDWVPKPIFS